MRSCVLVMLPFRGWLVQTSTLYESHVIHTVQPVFYNQTGAAGIPVMYPERWCNTPGVFYSLHVHVRHIHLAREVIRACICLYIFVSHCVGGSKALPRTLYRIKCVLAEQFIKTANYYKKHADGILR